MGGGRRGSDHLPPGTSPLNSFTLSSAAGSTDEASSSPDLSPDLSPSVSYSETNTGDHPNRATYAEVVMSYLTAPRRPSHALQAAKHMITRHKPGDWIEEVGGTKTRNYDIPETTTLLLVGPRGSGKSTLVNRITKVFQDDKFAPDRAQVSHNLSVTEGSCFLQEYSIPRNSKSLCVYDTRSLSTLSSDNFKVLQYWMMQGVCHRQMVIRDSDDVVTRKRIEGTSRQGQFCPCQKRMVNFVIFVVDGISVLKSMDKKDTKYTDMLAETFNYPFLSFQDNKPVVVVTHGDELSLSDRADIRSYLGELLGIPPLTQIFDIPGETEYDTELAIVDMLRYSMEHADRNLPFKQNILLEGQRILLRLTNKFQGFDATLECVLIFLWTLVLMFWAIKTLMKW